MGGGILYHVIRWNVLFAANLQEELGIVAGQSQSDRIGRRPVFPVGDQ